MDFLYPLEPAMPSLVDCSALMKQNRTDIMGSKANPEDVVPFREALNMEIMINQALIDLLVSKDIITQKN